MEIITAKHKILKIISTFLIVFMILPAVLLSSPKKTQAVIVPVIDSSNDPWEWLVQAETLATQVSTVISEGYNKVQTFLNQHQWLQKMAEQLFKVAAKRLLAKMTQATINWINSDFHGSPLYLERPDSFFKDIAKSSVKDMVDMIGYDTLRFPFGKQVALEVIDSYKRQLAINSQYTLSKVIHDPDLLLRFQNDFDFGGWNGFLINTQYPQNNYLGFKMMVEENLASKVEGTMVPPAQKAKELLQQGMGFLSPQKCTSNDKYNNGFNEFHRPSFQYPDFDDTKVDDSACAAGDDGNNCRQEKQNEAWKKYNEERDAKRAKWAEANECPGGLTNTTPGSVAAHQIFDALGSPLRTLELDSALGNVQESVAAILDALINHFFDKGLNMLSDIVSGRGSGGGDRGNDNWNFEGHTLDDHDVSASGEPLTVGAGQTDEAGNALVCPAETNSANDVTNADKMTSVTVSVDVGKTITVPISGGDGEYFIKDSGNTEEEIPANTKPKDTTVATAKIEVSKSSGKNNKLKITGIKTGTTTLTIEDFSSPIQNAFVTINVDLPLDKTNNNTDKNTLLVCPSNTISIAAGANSAFTATILGGDGNYSIQKNPDDTIASAEIANENLIVMGNQNGSTSLRIKDRSNPAKHADVNITVGASGLAVAPQNIPVAVGNTASAVISGGNGNYSVETQTNDSLAIATASVSGNKLNITGVAPGETKVTVQDSSDSDKTADVTITVGANGDLIVSPANIFVDSGQEITATIYGGKKPYSKQNGPNKKIAKADFSGDKLTVRGLGNGTTSLKVKDHSGKTAPVNITVGPQDSLVVTPTDFSINAGETKSFPISISGGVTPYVIAYQEDIGIANAALDVSDPSNPKLNITAGSKIGTATVTIQDSSKIAKTADISIETLASPETLAP